MDDNAVVQFDGEIEIEENDSKISEAERWYREVRASSKGQKCLMAIRLTVEDSEEGRRTTVAGLLQKQGNKVRLVEICGYANNFQQGQTWTLEKDQVPLSWQDRLILARWIDATPEEMILLAMKYKPRGQECLVTEWLNKGQPAHLFFFQVRSVENNRKVMLLQSEKFLQEHRINDEEVEISLITTDLEGKVVPLDEAYIRSNLPELTRMIHPLIKRGFLPKSRTMADWKNECRHKYKGRNIHYYTDRYGKEGVLLELDTIQDRKGNETKIVRVIDTFGATTQMVGSSWKIADIPPAILPHVVAAGWK